VEPDGAGHHGALAKSGDRVAFEALIRQEKAALYAFVRRYVGDADQAYDILQEAFIAAWRAIGRYDPGRPFGVWLRRIALNKCRDHARSAAVRRLIQGAFAADPAVQASPAKTEADTGLEGRLARLDRLIPRLPAIYKDPLLLTTTGGLSHEEAAQVLGVSSKAVEMRLYRARRLLADLWDREAL
jgi:RNA polymerase sigma factor (sigma-70 family)